MELKLLKWEEPITSLDTISNFNDIQRAFLVAENCLENAACFLLMSQPQIELARKYFNEAYIIFKEIILPYKNPENKEMYNKIEKLEEMIKGIDIDL